jgi:hypothetical protein
VVSDDESESERSGGEVEQEAVEDGGEAEADDESSKVGDQEQHERRHVVTRNEKAKPNTAARGQATKGGRKPATARSNGNRTKEENAKKREGEPNNTGSDTGGGR